jgi:hypothetical protein
LLSVDALKVRKGNRSSCDKSASGVGEEGREREGEEKEKCEEFYEGMIA